MYIFSRRAAMAKTIRAHRKLSIEELEPRVAPAAGLPKLGFMLPEILAAYNAGLPLD
jgi:hypothetical protein